MCKLQELKKVALYAWTIEYKNKCFYNEHFIQSVANVKDD